MARTGSRARKRGRLTSVVFIIGLSLGLPRLLGLRLEILLTIHPNQLEEITQREWADEQAQQPEVADAAGHADKRDQRMDRREAGQQQRPEEVVAAPPNKH